MANFVPWDSKRLFGSSYDFWTVHNRVDDQAKRLLEDYAIMKIEGIKWSRLRQLATDVLYLGKDYIKKVGDIREKGNYSAHRAQNIIKSSIKSLKTQQGVKIRTTQQEALDTLAKTEELFEVIVTKFFDKNRMEGEPYRRHCVVDN